MSQPNRSTPPPPPPHPPTKSRKLLGFKHRLYYLSSVALATTILSFFYIHFFFLLLSFVHSIFTFLLFCKSWHPTRRAGAVRGRGRVTARGDVQRVWHGKNIQLLLHTQWVPVAFGDRRLDTHNSRPGSAT